MAKRKTKAADYLGLRTERKGFTIVWNDFLESKLLNYYEKIVFIALKKFADNDTLVSFPSLNTLHDMTGISKSKIQSIISSLESKKVLEVKHRMDSEKGHKSNLYTLYDYAEMWAPGIDTDTASPDDGQRDTIRMINTLRAQGYTVTKEEEPKSELPTKVTDSDSTQKHICSKYSNDTCNHDNKSSDSKCQESDERYTLDQIHQLYEYDVIVFDHPEMKKDVDAIMSVLYDALNTRKASIRIDGEDKPSIVVIAKLMKLGREEIIFVVRRFNEQTDRIRNASAYILTMLYHAQEQYNFDIKNQISSNHGKN